MRTVWLRRAWLALLLLASSAAAATAQQLGRYSIALRDVPVAEALSRLVDITAIDLLYDADVVRDRTTVCRVEEAPSEELLRCIVTAAGLDFYRTSSGTYVVIEGVEDLPATTALTGVVVDGRSGRPVPFAEVESTARAVRGWADASGVFTLAGLPPGEIDIVASSLGYRPTRTRLTLSSGTPSRARVVLDPEALALGPIVVSGLDPRLSEDELGEARWSRADPRTGVAPSDGVLDVPPASLGVTRTPLSPDLGIQGGAAGEHMVRLDGVPVFEPVSLGGIRSAFSPLAVERVTIHKAGFGVGEGSLVGAVVDVEQGAGGSKFGPSIGSGVEAQVGPYDAEARVVVPLPGMGRPGSLLVAGRSSLWDLFREPVLDGVLRDWNNLDPVLMRSVGDPNAIVDDGLAFDAHRHGSDLAFSDLHLRADLPLGAFRRLEVSAYRGDNSVGTELFSVGARPGSEASRRALVAADAYAWTNTVGQVGLHTLIGDRTSVRLRVRGSRYELDHTYAMTEPRGVDPDVTSGELEVLASTLGAELAELPRASDGNRVTEWGASATADYAAGAGHSLAGGLDLATVSSRVHLDDPYYRRLESSLDQTRVAAWLQDRVVLGERWRVEGGVRATWLGGRDGEAFLEPRLAVRYDDPEAGHGGWSLRMATGMYHQFLTRYDVTSVGPSALVPSVQFWMPPDTSVAPMRAYHVGAEAVWRPIRGLEVRAEAYHKVLDRILALDYRALVLHDGEPLAQLPQSSFIGEAEGAASGVGVRVERRSGPLRTVLAYDFTASERTFPSRFDGERQPVPWLEPHRVSAGADWAVGSGFRLRADGTGIWGRAWGLRRAYYDFLTLHDFGGPTLGAPEDDGLPALLQVDVGLGWEGRVGDARIGVNLELRNVLDHDNVLDRSLRRRSAPGQDAYVPVPRLLPGFTPLLMVRLGR